MKSIIAEANRWSSQKRLVGVLLCCLLGLSIVLAEEESDMPSLVARFNKFYQTKQFSQAAPIAEKILQIREQTMGPDARGTAAAANNLAEVYRYMGQYAKAEPFYQRALTIFEKELGPDHPDVASVLANIGLLYSETGQYAKAEPIYQRVLKSEKTLLGRTVLKRPTR